MAAVLIAVLLGTGPALAQVPVSPPSDPTASDQSNPTASDQSTPGQPPSDQAASDQAAPPLTAQQLDQLLAPVALYPDPLLAQILMAASYPLEVVQADRWLQSPANASLTNDQLAAALDQQSWDPSVKSLVPFPRILALMDTDLDWTERLGDAFVANQPAVMDSVQRLRERAQTAGDLGSTPQRVVTDEGQAITIEPPNPQFVYVPIYNPAVAYGPWPDPALPPYTFGDYFGDDGVDGLGFGWFGVAIVTPLWGWHHWDWGRRRIDIDRNRFAALDRFHPPIRDGAWVHDPSRGHGVFRRGPVAEARFPRAPVWQSPADPHIVRGFQTEPAAQFRPPPGVQPRALPPEVVRPQVIHRPVPPRVFASPGRGVAFQPQVFRGPVIRSQAPVFRPSGGGPHVEPSVGAAAHR